MFFCVAPTPTVSTSIPNDPTFEVHYIDIGQTYATLLLCDDEAMLIDGGNRNDSSLIYSYLTKHNISA